MIDKIKKDICNNWVIILIVIIYLLFMQMFFSTLCPIKAFFHIDCPGCGLTHATIYILKGDFLNAFKSNYTVFLWLPLIIAFFVDRYIYKFKFRILHLFFIIVCIITLLRYFLNFII